MCLPDGTGGEEPVCQFRRCKSPGFDPWVRKIHPEEDMATHSRSLAWNLVDRGAWRATVRGITESRTRLK